MPRHVTLREFSSDELILDAGESLDVLRFIFASKGSRLDSLVINDQLRGFAQALLLEAVDASFSLGFVDALVRSVVTLRPSLKGILLKFARNAAKHWFKYATAYDLQNAKVYELVRRDLEWSFGRLMALHLEGVAAIPRLSTGVVAYRLNREVNFAWG